MVLGSPAGGEVDRYIRTLSVLPFDLPDWARREESEGHELDRTVPVAVGCDNAVMERLAAKTVTFSLYGDLDVVRSWVADRGYEDHELTCDEPTPEGMDSALGNAFRVRSAVTIAKRLRNKAAAEKLTDLLAIGNFAAGDEPAAWLLAAFLSFGDVAKRDRGLSARMTDALARFVRNHVSEPHVSVVYAIESLGLVSRYHAACKESAATVLKGVVAANHDAHVVWSTLVALKSVASSTVRPDFSDIETKLQQPTIVTSAVREFVDESFKALKEAYSPRRTALQEADQKRPADPVLRPRYCVFLSYESGAREFADQLRNALEDLNVEVWYDRTAISVGEMIPERISDGIKQSDLCVAIFTPRYPERHWTRQELAGWRTLEEVHETNLIVPVVIRQSLESFKKSYPVLGARRAILPPSERVGDVRAVAESIARICSDPAAALRAE